LLFELGHFLQLTKTTIQFLLLIQNIQFQTKRRNGGKLESEPGLRKAGAGSSQHWNRESLN
jgi:hypothetical protein